MSLSGRYPGGLECPNSLLELPGWMKEAVEELERGRRSTSRRPSGMGVSIYHRTDAAVGPDVDGGLDHIDDGVDGEDNAQDGNGGADTRHE